ncbi:MAG: ARMT1-like domain-containing protein [archaeon]|nr:ARMT1-like domain-containing protein [archaeon]
MKASADCGPCLMKRILFQSRIAGTGREFEAVKQCMGRYSELMVEGVCSAAIATDVHALCYRIMDNDDPYLQMKIDADRIAEQYLPLAQRFIDSSEDRLHAAVRVSLIGNIMDFGSGIAIDSPDEFGRMFDSLLNQGIESDEFDMLEQLISSSSVILYAFDNCGESQFDKLLIREIKALGKRVVGVVRGAPILNDVTMEDALRIGLDRELDRIVSTGEFAIGFPEHVGDPGFQEELASAGLLITKGMANYESLSDYDMPVPVVFLLRAKCAPVAASLNVPVGTNVVRVKRVE